MGALTIEEIRKRKILTTRKVAVPLDPELALRVEEKRIEWERQKTRDSISNTRDLAPALEKELRALEEELEEQVAWFTFQALPREEFRKLVASAPPRPEDVEDGLTFDPEYLFAPLLAASCIDPILEISDAEAIQAEWEDATVTLLFASAYGVNSEVRNIPKGSRP